MPPRACYGLSYSRMIDGLNKAGVEIDRKVLADIAVHDTAAFGAIAQQAKTALGIELTREGVLADLTALREQALAEIAACGDLAALEEVRVRWLGKKGRFTEQAQGARRAARGRAARRRCAHQRRQGRGAGGDRGAARRARRAPTIERRAGRRSHRRDARRGGARSRAACTRSPRRGCASRRCFAAPASSVAAGPEIEDDFHNFEALNIPPNHPARAMHDTFYFPDGRLLRTHTSPVQIRALQERGAPLALIAPGRVYRRDSDMTHSPMFHQLEGLVVGENVSFANMKAVLHGFLQAFFERELAMRLRPVVSSRSPSPPPRSTCRACSATARAAACASTPAGSRSPAAAWCTRTCSQASGVDAERYTGYAFGAGIDRLAMLRYGVNDLRLFFENDLRFLQQFRQFPRMKIPYSLAHRMGARCRGRRGELGRASHLGGVRARIARAGRAAPSRGVVVAEILAAERHPQADKLQVCRVSTGSGAPLQIVCGAPQCARGTQERARRGRRAAAGRRRDQARRSCAASSRRACWARRSELGLGEASRRHPGAARGRARSVRICASTSRSMSRCSTSTCTPNRGDAMSVIGIAREVAALAGAALAGPAIARVRRDAPASSFPVRLEAAAACPRFAGCIVRGIDNRAATPLWMRERLRRAGAALHQPGRRRDQLRDARARAADACVRPRQAAWRHHACASRVPGETLALLDGRTVTRRARHAADRR